MTEEFIYLDNNSTTPLDSRVLEVMMPYLTNFYGNAASSHVLGRKLKSDIDKSRELVADLINANSEDIMFTSGATESINIALQGIISNSQFSKSRHIVTVSTEHPATLDTCRYLEKIGISVTYVGVDEDGLINKDELSASIKEETCLVSVMLVNNETGVIQDINEIAKIAHSKGAFFMTDASQAFGKMPIDVIEDEIDILAFSGHKIYGPMGIGGLYLNPGIKVKPLIYGGGQERNLRSGTLNVPGIIGIGKASNLAKNEMVADTMRIGQLSERLLDELLTIDKVSLNGSYDFRLNSTCNICFEGISNEEFLLNLNHILVSNGSACSSFTIEPSHVLLSMGLSKQQANSSMRFSLGRFTTRDEVEVVINSTKEIIKRLRSNITTYNN
jgi:cysteine desulfurase